MIDTKESGKRSYLLSIACGKSQAKLIKTARNLGFGVIAVDQGDCICSVDEHIKLSTYNPKPILASIDKLLCGGLNIVGVLARSSGPAVLTGNQVAEYLSLPRCGEPIARSSNSKLDLYQIFSGYDIPLIPTIQICTESSDILLWEKIIIKPDVSVMGKKDIFVLPKSKEQRKGLYHKSKRTSLNGRVVAQPYIEGRDIGLGVLSHEGSVLWHTAYEESVVWSNYSIASSKMNAIDAADIEDVQTKMLGVVSRIVEISQASGFAFFSFRVREDKSCFLYEINPGLVGDSLIDSVFFKQFPTIDFYQAEIYALIKGSLKKTLNEEINAGPSEDK